jgi:SAM-dependent methyltransferase
MSYYDDKENVEEYVKMAEGYDGREFIPVLRQYLPDGATVLELGMGPGKDVEILGEYFQVTGSDHSQIFVARYLETHPDADVVRLDACAMAIERTFDGIYSNKVLYHLTRDELRQSLKRQLALLNPGGILFHTMWAGEGAEDMKGLHFEYVTEASFADLLEDGVIVEAARYAEMEPDDSIYFVVKRDGAV